MADNELYLHYADLTATTTKFTALSAALTAVKVTTPDTGTVNIFWPMQTLHENVVSLAGKLDKVGAACTEVAKEVQVVDANGVLILRPIFTGLDNTGYVHHGGSPYGGTPYLDQPTLEVDGVLPPGPYATPVPPAPEPETDR